MKKLLIILILAITQIIYSQEVPYYLEDALDYSLKYKFEGSNYIVKQYNNYDYSYGAASYLQSKYDNGFKIVNEEIFKLKGLILINIKNREYISEYNIKLKSEYYRNNYTNINLGDDNNLNIIINRITGYINNKWMSNNIETTNPVSDEIKLLKKIYTEYYRLKYNSGFYSSKRWMELKNLIIELENCPVSQIPFLGPKYNLY